MELSATPPASECIWCNRVFRLGGFSTANDTKLGRVRRSEEHLIPRSVQGKVWTLDVCKPCNDRFGSDVDCLLLRDGMIIEAAQRAGICLPDLLPNFRVTQKVEDGRDVQVTVKDGEFRSEPSFVGNSIRFPGDETGWKKRDEHNAKAVLLGIVKNDPRVALPDEQIRREIDALFTSLEKNPQHEAFNSAIHQGLRRTSLDSKSVVSGATTLGKLNGQSQRWHSSSAD